ncbi:hypothetical protein PAECIP111894_02978 [Paenibacillus pseudetheri]|uniref:Uncharacterized protein n=1 Tax=Paenibacillus pseudetheri TaxID=2897682 RepID=A0ABM9BDI2_9BACL|nr:hypothetical protein PAECIP111894_02978 [Paenibacillus pseudetheri]
MHGYHVLKNKLKTSMNCLATGKLPLTSRVIFKLIFQKRAVERGLNRDENTSCTSTIFIT